MKLKIKERIVSITHELVVGVVDAGLCAGPAQTAEVYTDRGDGGGQNVAIAALPLAYFQRRHSADDRN